MRVFGTIVGWLTMMTVGSLASAATVGVVTESTARMRRMETNAVSERSSAERRMGKSVVATLQPVGVVIAPVPAAGLGLGYFIDSQSVLQVEGSYGRLRPDNVFDVNVRTVAVNLKHFVGETFYIKGGAAFRETSLNNVPCRVCDPGVSREWGNARTIDGEFAVGNQWQWESLTIGADWVGVLVPTVQLGDSRVTDAFGIASNDVKQARDVWETLTRTAGLSMGRVYVGASF